MDYLTSLLTVLRSFMTRTFLYQNSAVLLYGQNQFNLTAEHRKIIDELVAGAPNPAVVIRITVYNDYDETPAIASQRGQEITRYCMMHNIKFEPMVIMMRGDKKAILGYR